MLSHLVKFVKDFFKISLGDTNARILYLDDGYLLPVIRAEYLFFFSQKMRYFVMYVGDEVKISKKSDKGYREIQGFSKKGISFSANEKYLILEKDDLEKELWHYSWGKFGQVKILQPKLSVSKMHAWFSPGSKYVATSERFCEPVGRCRDHISLYRLSDK